MEKRKEMNNKEKINQIQHKMKEIMNKLIKKKSLLKEFLKFRLTFQPIFMSG